MFGDMQSDIQTRIPDRPQRAFPQQISDMPEIPWLASHYVPQANTRPTIKSMISKLVKTAIPILGTLVILSVIGSGAFSLLSFYAK